MSILITFFGILICLGLLTVLPGWALIGIFAFGLAIAVNE